MKNQAKHAVAAKELVVSKADAPKQLAGYLGWSKTADASFSTSWNTTGVNAAKSLLRDDGSKKAAKRVPAKKQALVEKAVPSTPFSRMLEDQMAVGDWPAMDWGNEAKQAHKAKPVSMTKTNTYLDSVGWTAPARENPPSQNPYLQSFRGDRMKNKFLAAAEMTDKKDTTKANNYFDSLMPGAAFELSVTR
jgi:hypothetical protein